LGLSSALSAWLSKTHKTNPHDGTLTQTGRPLVQRATRDFGHCSFTPTELVSTFVDLVKWVDGGLKPAGDNVLDPAAVAAPDFGCTYTDKSAARLWDQPGLGFLKPAACPAP
jgi:hypothetical protein